MSLRIEYFNSSSMQSRELKLFKQYNLYPGRNDLCFMTISVEYSQHKKATII
jgi:hypothetical protein